MAEIRKRTGNYEKVSLHVDTWLSIHGGETFTLDNICRHLEISERENRYYVAVKLSKEVAKGRLEKVNRTYRYINKDFKPIEWFRYAAQDVLPLAWPYSHADGSRFGFDGHLNIRPNDIVVVAGESNRGKSTFCRNLLWENMDRFPCRMLVNEWSPGRFVDVISRMGWASGLKEDGTPKFELLECYRDWKYAVRPGAVNIIDWLTVKDHFWEIDDVLEGIQQQLGGGVAVVAIQKAGDKAYGEGGSYSERHAALYLSIGREVLTVKKAKDWRGVNPDGQHYGFSIVDYGAQFAHIRPVAKCPKCQGRSLAQGTPCAQCGGTGYVDK